MTEDAACSEPLNPHQAVGLDAPLPVAFERLLFAQLDRSGAALTLDTASVDGGVHEARKRMKRFRGLIRLLRDRIGKQAYRRENIAVRDVARAIAPLRDGQVLIRTLEQLTRETPGRVDTRSAAELQAALVEAHDSRRARLLADPDLLPGLQEALANVRGRVADWRLSASGTGAGADWPAVLASGLRRLYRRGRRGYVEAKLSGDDETFHNWRKQVKYLRYGLEALQPMRPESLDALIASLDRLGEFLGDEHDLAVLRDAATEEFGVGREVLEPAVAESQERLRTQALELGARLYSDKPRKFSDRIVDHG